MEDKKIIETVEKFKGVKEGLEEEISKVIVGQKVVIEQLFACLFSQGHCLLVGVPGLAKTLLISTVSRCLDLNFSRIQFTPDLMPADITGYEILDEGQSNKKREFRFVPGPIFANVVLADEINRTPPKTQAALLQAMAEYGITSGGKTHELDRPFFVLATQNPIEQEGTYPLPEAQLDRFMFMVEVNYPSTQEEFDIVKLTTSLMDNTVSPILKKQDILDIQHSVRSLPACDSVIKTAVSLAKMTRPNDELCPPQVKKMIQWGAGPRAAQFLVLAAKAYALLDGRPTPSIDDVIKAAMPVLRHRIIPNYEAEAKGINSKNIIDMILSARKD